MYRQKILIGIPGYLGIVPECQESIIKMIGYSCRELAEDFEIGVKIVVKKEQFRARNALVQAAVGAQFDYLFMLDDDMVVPRDLLCNLLDHDVSVCGALYYQREAPYHPVVMRRHFNDVGIYDASFLDHTDPIFIDKGLHEVDIIGGGCMLFKTEVFSSLLAPYFKPELSLGTDISICGRIQDCRYKIHIDTSMELGHFSAGKIVTSRTIPLGSREVAKAKEDLVHDLCKYLDITKEELWHRAAEAGQDVQRQSRWHERDRSDWEGVKAFYQDYGDWHLYNLAYWNLGSDSIYKEWALTEGLALMPSGSSVFDYGGGLGHLSIALQKKGIHALNIDIDKSPTLDFVTWRNGLDFALVGSEVPELSEGEYEGGFLISVMDHLMQPYEVIKALRGALKTGGFLVCDYLVFSDENNPQHIHNYDVYTFDKWMNDNGFTTSPEYPWLFFKK